MSRTIHVAITRRVRKEHTKAFERDLAELARRLATGDSTSIPPRRSAPAPGRGAHARSPRLIA
ncbi:hypothetical protein WMF27_20265 [Sorangium sp. So ce281]|uniref:hypothetical protein n=1 Tax=unclassified Sorangium TaxID=2621164 RepID=UPI003F5F4E84